MKRSVMLLAAVCLAVGCENTTTLKSKAPTKGVQVDVQAPGVRVQVNKTGTEVKTPAVEIKTKKAD